MAGDSCDEEGARKLKKKIEEYWAAQGSVPSVNLVDEGFVPQMRSARTDVRSNMVNGMPRNISNKKQKTADVSAPLAAPTPCKPFSIRNRKNVER